MSVKISSLELENVKRVRAVALEPTESGLTVIGGRNGQGKTSVLDAIAWALGGEKFRPSMPEREGSVLPPDIRVTLSNGIVVERRGKNSALKVTDPTGNLRGQKLLDTFVEKLALNLPKFMEASDKEKAETLLNIIGVGPQLMALDQREGRLYNERTMVGRVADQKAKHAAELPHYEDVPDKPLSLTDLIREQRELMARNEQRRQWIREYDYIMDRRADLDAKIEAAEAALRELREAAKQAEQAAVDAQHSPAELKMEDPAGLEEQIAKIEEINAMVRANMEREKAAAEAEAGTCQYDSLTDEIESVRAERRALLEGAQLPLPGLGVENGALVYNGQAWDCMSSSEQLRVATAIVRRLNPECGFVLMDKLEQMDTDTMNDFGAWLEREGLQVIATRVSTDADDCTIIIEDGMAVPARAEKTDKFTEGVF